MKKSLNVNTPAPFAPGDVFCCTEEETGNYYAFQIIEVCEDSTAVLLLDYFNKRQPAAADLPQMEPLRNTRWFFDEGSLVYRYTGSVTLPEGAVFVGNKTPMVNTPCKTYGSWANGSELLAEQEWKKLPADARAKFKKALTDYSNITVAGHKCKRSFSFAGNELLADLTDFAELDALPAAYDFEAHNWYPQLIPFLEKRYTAYRLTWENHQQTELDLSRTHLHEVKIKADGLKILHLGADTQRLDLYGKLSPNLRVSIQGEGKKLTVMLNLSGNELVDLKLPILRHLALFNADKFDLGLVPQYYPNLKWLRVVGKPGTVSNVAALGALHGLKSLLFEDIFGFSGAEFPAPACFAGLKTLWLESIPEEAGKYLKKLYKGKVAELDITKLRKPEWLAENLDNPLRSWDGNEFVPKGKAKKAADIYRAARREAITAADAFIAAGNSDIFVETLETIAKNYAVAFNKLDGRSNFIETEEREDICGAFDVILSDVQKKIAATNYSVDTDKIFDALDNHRDW